MKKGCLIFLFVVIGAGFAFAQQNRGFKVDTIDADLILRIVNHRLTHADSVRLRVETSKTIRRDTVMLRINEGQLAQKNARVDSINLSTSKCYFEDKANAMALYDIGMLRFDGMGMVLERHKRVKIFNDEGVKAANIRLNYTNQFGNEEITEVAGRTMNFKNGKIEYTDLDPKLIYRETLDKNHFAVVFTMPNVKAGSVFEIGYKWRRVASRNIPGWDFQTDIPTQFSQFAFLLSPGVQFLSLARTIMPFAKDSTILGGRGHVWEMRDVAALKFEPFMRSPADGIQSLGLVLTTVSGLSGYVDLARTWATIGKQFADDKVINKSFDQNLNDEHNWLMATGDIPITDEKVEYLFNAVKTSMKWNSERYWMSKDGLKKAWESKSGNWGEINMVLCQFLNRAGVKAFPMLVSTKDNGKIYSDFPNIYMINKLVVYVPIDSARYYVLDASDKYANYDDVPFELLNSYGLVINKAQDRYDLMFLKNMKPVRQEITIDAEIKADGTMTGSTLINSYSYNKTMALELYNLLDQEKYKQFLSANESNMQIMDLKVENAQVDSLPLTQTINFKIDLPGTDDKYIYFNPNLFTGLKNNPFINERRFSDIDLGYVNLISISGKYKIPDGYKIESMPQNQTTSLPDRSISFRQSAIEENGYINVFYVINYKRSFFSQSEYYLIHPFFKKMTDILNQQIVLKKI